VLYDFLIALALGASNSKTRSRVASVQVSFNLVLVSCAASPMIIESQIEIIDSHGHTTSVSSASALSHDAQLSGTFQKIVLTELGRFERQGRVCSQQPNIHFISTSKISVSRPQHTVCRVLERPCFNRTIAWAKTGQDPSPRKSRHKTKRLIKRFKRSAQPSLINIRHHESSPQKGRLLRATVRFRSLDEGGSLM
jgi:hypothetical protein